jgi:hypothetical protein
MRKDMAKVIVERPRTGGSSFKKGETRRLQREPLEDRSTKQSMKGPWRDRKSLNENLSPLRRYLQSHCGRPWNEVHSDIASRISVSNAVQKHVRDHLDDYVEQEVRMVDGKPFHTRWGHAIISLFYVHPDTGILLEAPRPRRRRWQPKRLFETVNVDALHKFVKIKDIWYYVTFKVGEKARKESGFDILIGDEIVRQFGWGADSNAVAKRAATNEWGADIVAVAKRQANSREIRQQIVPKLKVA